MPDLLLYSACDRFNYGDLLLPRVTRECLQQEMAGVTCGTYGVTARDWRPAGGDFVQGLSDLRCDAKPYSTVVVAGGEVLTQSWLDMYSSYLSNGARTAEYPALPGPEAIEFCRNALGGCSHRPFLLEPADFPAAHVRVAYNSVGGWPLSKMSGTDRGHAIQTLSHALHLSVRERETARYLHAELTPRIAPDAVSLMAELWSPADLRRLASPAVRTLLDRFGHFLCFQCGPHYGDAHSAALPSVLRSLHCVTALPIVAVPLAQFTGWDDRAFLRGFDPGPWWYYAAEAETVLDRACLLAHSKLVAATSLHALITGLSYERPIVGLASHDPKLGFYAESWLNREDWGCVPLGALPAVAAARLSRSPSRLSARLREGARFSLQDLARRISAS